jgi:hypothetical protein
VVTGIGISEPSSLNRLRNVRSIVATIGLSVALAIDAVSPFNAAKLRGYLPLIVSTSLTRSGALRISPAIWAFISFLRAATDVLSLYRRLASAVPYLKVEPIACRNITSLPR